jgi:hypothetical protein
MFPAIVPHAWRGRSLVAVRLGFLGIALTMLAGIALSSPAVGHADISGSLWTAPLESDGPAFAAPNGTILTSDCTDFVNNGGVIWHLPAVLGQPASCYFEIADSVGNTYVMTQGPSGEQVVESLTPTGALRWESSIEGYGQWRSGPVLGANGSVFFSGFNGHGARVMGFDQNTGAVTFSKYFSDVTGLHAYAGGVVVVNADSQIDYLGYDGSLLNEYQTGTPISAYEAYSNGGGANGTVFVAGYNGSCESNSHVSVEKVTPAGVAWTWTDPNAYCNQTGLTAMTDDGVILAREDASSAAFTALSAAGSEKWTLHPESPIGQAKSAGYLPVRVDVNGVIVVPTSITYHCASQPTEECAGDQLEFVSEQTKAQVAAPIQLTEGTGYGYELNSMAIDTERLYADGFPFEPGAPWTLSAFSVPGLGIDYQLSLQEALTTTHITPPPPAPPSSGGGGSSPPTGGGPVPAPGLNPCAHVAGGVGKRLLASLKCTLELTKLEAQCAVGVAGLIFLPLKSLDLIEAAKGISVINKLPAKLRPLGRFLYDLYHAKYSKHAPRGFRNGKESVATIKGIHKAWQLIKALPDLAKAISRSDFSQIALDLDGILGLKPCVQAVADASL